MGWSSLRVVGRFEQGVSDTNLVLKKPHFISQSPPIFLLSFLKQLASLVSVVYFLRL